MRTSSLVCRRWNEIVLSTLLFAGPAVFGADPDVTASRIGLTSSTSASDDFQYYGEVGGVRAFAVATTSCNIGDLPADWIAGAGARHPLIAQNMYRLLDGRFEQIGMSWLKHSFCAVSEPTCGACQATGCDSLGVGCADTYWAALNGDPGSLGPRSEVNPQGDAASGTHTHPVTSPTGPATLRGRLLITTADINAGGRAFVEAQYVTHDEPRMNRNNNASWREVVLTPTAISGVSPGQASVRAGEPAIFAWRDADPGVVIEVLDIRGEGRMHLGHTVTDLGNGTWHYEYALHNLNSHRGASWFSIPVPARSSISNIGFHDIDYHSGEPLDNTDWTAVRDASSITWSSPQTFAQDPNTNALRWGTLYNFRFDADTAPQAVSATVGMFRPGVPEWQTIPAPGPTEPATGTCVASNAPQAPAGPLGGPFAGGKNRYVSFQGGDAGRRQAVRVTFSGMPAGQAAWNGVTLWVGPPSLVSENGGSIDPIPGFAEFNAATLQCAPFFRDWSTLGTVHVSHEGIVPGGSLSVQFIDEFCPPSTESWYSDPLVAAASDWGDLVGTYDSASGAWNTPDGIVEVLSDVVAILDTFAGKVGAPVKVRSDLEPSTPDRLINISDAVRALGAFRGDPYPFSPVPPSCP
ncbi:MAG: hypothetical protein ACE5EX_02410 [Phycisphaerae bacterium]